MNFLDFKLVTIPTAQPRAGRHKLPSGITVTFEAKKDHKIHIFKADLRKAAADQMAGRPPLQGDVAIKVLFVLPRPGNLHWKTKAMPRVPHTKKPDADNLIKGLKDALKGIVWRDDNQVWHEDVKKVIASGSEPPHVHVIVSTGTKEDELQLTTYPR